MQQVEGGGWLWVEPLLRRLIRMPVRVLEQAGGRALAEDVLQLRVKLGHGVKRIAPGAQPARGGGGISAASQTRAR